MALPGLWWDLGSSRRWFGPYRPVSNLFGRVDYNDGFMATVEKGHSPASFERYTHSGVMMPVELPTRSEEN